MSGQPTNNQAFIDPTQTASVPQPTSSAGNNSSLENHATGGVQSSKNLQQTGGKKTTAGSASVTTSREGKGIP